MTYANPKIDKSLILDSTIRIKSADGYENLTEYELEPIDDFSDEFYFVSVVDGKIVSVCEKNTDGVFIGADEINVYTNPNYRNKGYGVSNVVAMSEYLLSLGKKVAYTSDFYNKASQKLAEKSGFEMIAKTYYYICYKD